MIKIYRTLFSSWKTYYYWLRKRCFNFENAKTLHRFNGICYNFKLKTCSFATIINNEVYKVRRVIKVDCGDVRHVP